MQIVKNIDDIRELKDNTVIGSESLELNNSDIRFDGVGNILFCEKGVKLVNSHLKFLGDNCIIYLSKSRYKYLLDVSVYRDSAFYIGENNYINGALHAIASERKSIFIGSGNLFSFGIWIRTADPHLVYSAESHKRINPSESVFLGDHVWVGQSAMILKRSKIASGSILGAMALLAGKEIPSNTSWGGNPARQIQDNVFWEESCVHKWNEAETLAHGEYMADDFIFNKDESTVSFYEIDSELDKLKYAASKLEYLKQLDKSKNRFFGS